MVRLYTASQQKQNKKSVSSQKCEKMLFSAIEKSDIENIQRIVKTCVPGLFHLISAVIKGDNSIVTLLCRVYPDMRQNIERLLKTAIQHNKYDIARLIFSYAVDGMCLMKTIAETFIYNKKDLREKTFHVEALQSMFIRASNKHQCLLRAIKHANTDLLTYLLESGTNKNVIFRAAAVIGRMSLIYYMIYNEIIDKHDALKIAADMESVPVIFALTLKCGADIHYDNDYVRRIAVEKNNCTLISFCDTEYDKMSLSISFRNLGI